MGLFSRKGSKISTNGNLDSNDSYNPKSPGPKSPPASRLTHGASFSSLNLADVKLPPPPDPALDPAGYLRSIDSVRARTRLIYQQAKKNQLNHFDVDGSKFQDTVDYVVSIIKVPKEALPPFKFPLLIQHREISHQTISLSQRMADGNTSRPAAGPESTNCFHRGHHKSTVRNAPADYSICS